MTKEDEDYKMKMYEAQAIVIEKMDEIDKLRKEKEELQQQVRLLASGNQNGASSSNQENVWVAIRNIREKMEEVDSFLRDRDNACKVQRMEREFAEGLKKLTTVVERQNAEYANVLERLKIVENSPKQESEETIVVMGGMRGKEVLDEMLILNKKRTKWNKIQLKLPAANAAGGSVCLNGEIYIVGGERLKKKLYKLDSSQMKWIELAEMEDYRNGISSSSLAFNGCIWVFGGWNGAQSLKTVEKYCPKTDKWMQMPEMLEERGDSAAAVCNGRIVVCGGISNGWLKSVECFDPMNGVWTQLVDMPAPRAGISLICNGSSLSVVGGADSGPASSYNTVWRFYPEEKNATWMELPPMRDRRRFLATALLNNQIYAIGGNRGGSERRRDLQTTEIFNGKSWRDGPELPYERDGLTSVVISSSLARILYDYQTE